MAPSPNRPISSCRRALLALALPALLAACTMEISNTRPAREIAPAAPPAGDLYAGWRVFQDKCAACHGAAADGSGSAPDLLAAVRTMSSRQFAALVLQRYELGLPPAAGAQDQSTIDTRIEDILRRSEPPIAMPAWQGDPAVNAHIIDLYAYLSARADGKLGVGRP